MIRIRNLESSDINKILAISDAQLGENYITIDDLAGYHTIVAEDDEQCSCVGFCLSCVSQDGTAYVRTVAVSPDYMGRGIGTALVAKSVEYLKDNDAKTILSPLWKHEGGVNSGVIFRRNGFVPKQEIPDYWYADSLEKGYTCPVCGKGCHCSCVMYELMLP